MGHHLHKFQHCHYQFYTIFFINFNGQFTTALCLMSLYVLQIYQAMPVLITNLRIDFRLWNFCATWRQVFVLFLFFFFRIFCVFLFYCVVWNLRATYLDLYIPTPAKYYVIVISHAFKCEYFIVAFLQRFSACQYRNKVYIHMNYLMVY